MARQRNISSEPELQRVDEAVEETTGTDIAIRESMYIGPNIPGVIHKSAIYMFGRERLTASEEDLTAALDSFDEKGRTDAVSAYIALQMAVAKFPEIAELIVPVEGIMQGLNDIKTRGTDLYRANRALIKAASRR